METCRVLTMLNAQASRQLQNEQLDAAKRTVNEAIRYYDESKSILRSSNLPPNEAALVQCQAQVSALLKLKIGRREAAMGSQTHNDRLTQSGKKMITQSTRSLREILQDKKTTPPPMIQRTVTVNVNHQHHQQIASNFSHRPHSTVYVVPPPPPPSSSVDFALSASASSSSYLSPAATKPTTTALEEWLRLTRSMNDTYNHVPSTAGGVNHINNNNNLSSCITDNEDGEDMGYCDCAVQIKRKYQQHQAQQQSLQQLKAPQSTMATTSSTATTASVAATTTSTTTVASRAEETETQPNAF